MRNFREVTASEIRDNLLNLKHITFEVTDACNLKCKYCGYGDMYYGYDKRESKYLPVNKAKLIIDYLNDLWQSDNTNIDRPRTNIAFYGGEPLLNVPFIKEVISYVEQLGADRNFVFSMTTNAMLLHRYMDYLVEKNFNLLISLDGDRRGQSYRVTKSGENSFDTVIRNVKALQKKYPEYFKDHVNFNSVLHNRNSVESTYTFIKKTFDKSPAISELNNSEIREDKKEEFERTYKNKMESLRSSENYEKLSEDLFVKDPQTRELLLFLRLYSGNVFTDYNEFLMDESKTEYTVTGTCIPFSKKMFITVNGKILQCERIDHVFSLGHISDDKVFLDPEEVARRFNSLTAKMRSRCKSCKRRDSCNQCIYYIPDINGSNPQCNGYMDEEDFKRYSSYCMGYLAQHPELYKKLMTEVKMD
ncbi:MAG: radical SAM peptide maturase [Bacteroidales bacterium]|jgi:uncharacterized protein|nr:radical SAM peptide maturase [Bacteroidales bacterium]